MPSSRPAAKAADMELARTGELVVKVTRPSDPPIPAGIWSHYGEDLATGRHRWHKQPNPQQDIRVGYEVRLNRPMLDDLERRAANNRSGCAVRGPGRAEAGRKATVDLSDGNIRAWVRSAANNDTHRLIDGPVRVTVKLLEKPEGVAPVCTHCKQTFTDHERIERTAQGDWGEPDAHGRREWDVNLPRVDAVYLCPQP